MSDNVVALALGGKQPPQPPRLRAIGCRMPGVIVTGNLEERLIVDNKGDQWMPITYLTVEGRCSLLMNCADSPAAAVND